MLVREFIQRLGHDVAANSPPPWPCDVFGVAAVLLQRVGGYQRTVRPPWPPERYWKRKLERAAQSWSTSILQQIKSEFQKQQLTPQQTFKHVSIPAFVKTKWDILCGYAGRSIEDVADPQRISDFDRLFEALISLMAVADHAYGLMINQDGSHEPASGRHPETHFALWVNQFAGFDNSLSVTLNLSEVRVLPKIMAPSVGLSIRSLSHYLAIWTEHEVQPVLHPIGNSWIARLASRKSRGSSLYVLLCPWPYEIRTNQFSVVKPCVNEINLAAGFGFFQYKSSTDAGTLTQKLGKLIHESTSLVGRVDAVVLPEAAINSNEYDQVQMYLSSLVPLSIIGVQDSGINRVHIANAILPKDEGENESRGSVSLFQDKHHRWKIERNQILQYRLGTQLDPDTEWWESQKITQRKLTLLTLDPEFLLAALVCEDLARQDPVSRLLRAVGPNLVVSILMDGPQVKGRWSDRYATVLADDPGSSVLTLTSHGMIKRCRSKSGKPESRSISIWRDAIEGVKEVPMLNNEGGVLLRLELTETLQYTADRRDPIRRLVPVLKEMFQLNGE